MGGKRTGGYSTGNQIKAHTAARGESTSPHPTKILHDLTVLNPATAVLCRFPDSAFASLYLPHIHGFPLPREPEPQIPIGTATINHLVLEIAAASRTTGLTIPGWHFLSLWLWLGRFHQGIDNRSHFFEFGTIPLVGMRCYILGAEVGWLFSGHGI